MKKEEVKVGVLLVFTRDYSSCTVARKGTVVKALSGIDRDDEVKVQLYPEHDYSYIDQRYLRRLKRSEYRNAGIAFKNANQYANGIIKID